MALIPDMPTVRRARITFFHVAVVGLSLMLTFSAWQFAKYQIETRTQQRFEVASNRALGLITTRMKKYEDALWSGVASVRSHGDTVTYDQWKSFAHSLRINEKYPGINGIGLIHFLDNDTIAPYISAQRKRRPEFNVFPDHENPNRMPITFIEPEDSNRAAIGLDVAHEINRRTAALASRDTGTAQITGPIVLVQDASSTPGFLFYVPFYQGGRPQTQAARDERSLGAVYAPFVVHELMDGLLAKELRSVRFSIRDGTTTMYDEHAEPDPAQDADPMYTKQTSLNIYGREWRLDIRSSLDFRAENTYSQPTIILLAGLLVEGLIISLLILMSRANHQAISYADKVTAALQRQTEELARINSTLSRKNFELEQFSYVASHDLKTPIRGIAGLTEMIEEDLEDYLISPTANPDVGANLTHIHERVARMNELTNAILQFSQIDPNGSDTQELVIAEVMQALVSDFGLEPDQMHLAGDVASISCDSFNLRRVLENLVGNAVKYHDGRSRFQIDITASAVGNMCQFIVADNGPGIDPQYHARVFDVFQTLRLGNAPESTGIGLSIVKKSVERHGGQVTLSSNMDEGATFTFQWPLESTAIPATQTQNAA